jgi:hypothetical protein
MKASERFSMALMIVGIVIVWGRALGLAATLIFG